MSLDKILERIRLDGERQAADIVLQADEEACLILEQARQEAAALYQSAYREALFHAEGDCSRLLNEARFEASCLAGQAREQFIEAALEGLHTRLERARESPDYPQALHRIALETLPPENGIVPQRERVVLEADPRDRAALEVILRRAGLDIEVRYTLECLGGVVACAPDGGSRVVNTLESRLERALPYLRRMLARMFEEETAGAAAPVAGRVPAGDGAG